MPKFVTSAYDWADRPLTITQPDLARRTFAYSLLLSPTGQANPGLYFNTQTDELQRTSYVWSSTRGDVIRTMRQLGTGFRSEFREYDALGRMTGVSDAGGAVWANVYDMLGSRLSATDPDLGTWTYQYNSANQLISQTDAPGVRTALSYDKAGRLPPLKNAAAPPACSAKWRRSVVSPFPSRARASSARQDCPQAAKVSTRRE